MKPSLSLTLVLMLAGCGLNPAEQMERAKASYNEHKYLDAKLDLVALEQDNAATAQSKILLARTVLAMGDGEGARTALENIPAPNRPADYDLLLGESALLRNQPDDALRAVRDDEGSEAERIRALAYLSKGDREGAAQAFAKGAAKGKTDPRFFADYALFKLRNGDTRTARSLVNTALRSDPASIDALLIDGEVATAEGNLARALASYSKAHAAYPDSLAAIAGKAAALGDLGRMADMKKTLDEARGMIGSDGKLSYLQARLAAARNDWKMARAILQANESSLNGRPEATLLYAEALDHVGQIEQARARLVPLVNTASGNAPARRLLGSIQMKLGDAKQAAATLAPLAQARTASVADKRLYAQAAKAAGMPDAESIAAKAIFPSPQSLGSAMASADAAMKARNWANAAAIYERIVAATDGKNPLVLNNLAFAQSELGNKSEALRNALKALKYAPGNASVMDTAAWLLFETGADKAKARSLLREAAAKAPKNETIARHLRKIQAEANEKGAVPGPLRDAS